MNRNSIQYFVDKEFGNYTGLLVYMGERGCRKIHTKESVTREFFELEKKVGRQPTLREVNKIICSVSSFIKLFGKYSNFLKSIGRESKTIKYHTKESVTRKFFKLEKRLGRQPSLEEFMQYKKVYSSTLRRLFGNPEWSNFLKSMDRVGLSKNTKEKENG